MSLHHTDAIPLKYLWMDDEIDTIRNYARLLNQDRPNVTFDFAESIGEAWSALDAQAYDGFLIDCRMSRHDDSVNGAHMLLDVNRRHKTFPTFAYSAYLDDPKYADPLRQSYVVATDSKAETFDMPLGSDPFFVSLFSAGAEYARVKGLYPERIEFRDYDRAPEKYADQIRVHWRKHKRWIRADMARLGYSWVIVCGEQIVDGSADLAQFPTDEKIASTGEHNNLIPFAYSSITLPEDAPQPTCNRSPWKLTTVGGDDIYPCITAIVGGVELVDDFDTGAAATFASDRLLPLGKWNFWAESETPHLGRSFEYCPRNVPVTIAEHDGKKQTRQLSVVVIRDWVNSSFTMFNPDRQVLFGRDLLRTFDVEITLHGRTRETSVRIIP